MSHGPMRDLASAGAAFFVVLAAHYGRLPEPQDYTFVAATVQGNTARLVIETTDAARVRFHADIDADAVPAVRQAMGIVGH